MSLPLSQLAESCSWTGLGSLAPELGQALPHEDQICVSVPPICSCWWNEVCGSCFCGFSGEWMFTVFCSGHMSGEGEHPFPSEVLGVDTCSLWSQAGKCLVSSCSPGGTGVCSLVWSFLWFSVLEFMLFLLSKILWAFWNDKYSW